MVDLQSLQIERRPPRARRRRGRWPLLLLLLAVAAAGVWLGWPQLRAGIDALRLPAVHAVQLRLQDAAAAAAVAGTAANGHVVAARRAALSSDVPGRIVELNVTEGSVVRRGDVVARLYADEYRAALDRAIADVAVAAAGALRAAANVDASKAAEQQAQTAQAAATAQLAEAQAQQVYAAAEHARAADLVASGIGSPRDLELARSQLDASQARVRSLAALERSAAQAVAAAAARVAVAAAELQTAQAQQQVAAAARAEAQAALDKTDVRAPFDGVVVLKDAEVGEVVSPNVQGGSTARGAVCTLVDFDSLEVQATVPELNLAAVRLGAPADVFLDARPERAYAGRVDRIWPTADRQRATIEVRIALLQKDELLRPEMGVRVVFRPPDAAAAPPPVPRLLLPEAAVVERGGRQGAFVLDGDAVRFTAAEFGARQGGRAVVESGLQPGMRVVVDPPPSLGDGDRVRLAAEDQQP